MPIILHINEICVCYTIIMPSENRRHDKVPCNLRPEGGLKIVGSVAGIESWRSLWNWLLASESPTKPAAKESEVADGDS